MYLFSMAAATDRGAVRRNNEDCYSVNDCFAEADDVEEGISYEESSAGCALCAVCDGIYASSRGELASQTVCEQIAYYYNTMLAISEFEDSSIERRIIKAFVRKINRSVRHLRAELKDKQFGTTCSLIYFRQTEALIFSLGDSVVFRISGGSIQKLTTDDTRAQQLRDASETDLQLTGSPLNHILTGYLGMRMRDLDKTLVNDNIPCVDVTEGDRFIICSDGLTDELTEDEILGTALSGDAITAAEELIRQAKDHGGRDNITVVVIDVCGDNRIEAFF